MTLLLTLLLQAVQLTVSSSAVAVSSILQGLARLLAQTCFGYLCSCSFDTVRAVV
jgi:hypothetical protein